MTVNLETKVEIMATDIKYLKEEMAEIKQLIKDHVIEERGIWGTMMDRKADIWVENAVRYGIYTVAGIIIAALMGVILIKSKGVL